MVSLMMLQAGNLDSRIFGESLTPGEFQTSLLLSARSAELIRWLQPTCSPPHSA